MPSILLGTQSGGIPVLSGFFSGQLPPFGGVQFINDRSSSGSVYINFGLPVLSGGVTIQSGGANFSGSLRDGIQMPPAVSFFVPLAVLQNPNTRIVGGLASGGDPNVWVATDAASGFCRLYWVPM